MHIEENKSLKQYNTFGIDSNARYFISVTKRNELKKVLNSTIHDNKFILGGGSNLLLTKDIEGLVIHIDLKGIKILKENKEHVYLQVMAGENWHELVNYCLENDFGGIENLSLIPGNVGSAPIQNIGAYGVELKDVFDSCLAISTSDLTEREFSKEECQFGYRKSIFKNKEKGNYIIIQLTLKLTKNNHKKKVNYGDIQKLLIENNIENPSLKDISETIIKIRQSKLPDPKVLGNSGSFFKNPIVNLTVFKKFIIQYPKAPFYKISDTNIKIPAGWLIEKAGFIGERIGVAGVHDKQALVLVNHGEASGEEILELAKKIQKMVEDLFGIAIEPEVNII
jgi:UDP-N-acetylmuramate dehydrogenase